MKLIDANVVIYALGNPHPYKEVCQQVFARVLGGGLEANIDTELLQEVVHYYQRRRRIGFGFAAFDSLLTMFSDPFSVTRRTTVLMRDVLDRHPHLEARDALHVAVALQEGLEGIVSADKGLDAVTEIARFDPAEL